VLEDFKGKSVVDLNVEREKELAKERNNKWVAMTKEQRQKAVQTLLNLPETVPLAKRRVVEEIKRGDILITKVTYETEPGILLPAIEYRPADAHKAISSTVVLVDGSGKEAMTKHLKVDVAERAEKHAERIIMLDLRGFGETAPGKNMPNRPSYFGIDFSETFLALHLNRPLLGQRTYDLLSVLGTMQKDRVFVLGRGVAAPAAVHAALLSPTRIRVLAEGLPISWSDVVKAPVSYDQLANVVPAVLAVYDLPDLVNGLLTDVHVLSAADPKGETVNEEDRKRAYKTSVEMVISADFQGFPWGKIIKK
jgi:hypothetical protein